MNTSLNAKKPCDIQFQFNYQPRMAVELSKALTYTGKKPLQLNVFVASMENANNLIIQDETAHCSLKIENLKPAY